MKNKLLGKKHTNDLFKISESRKRKFREDEMEKKFKHNILNAVIKHLNSLLPEDSKLVILSGAIADETNAFFNFILLKKSLRDVLSTPNTEKWGKKRNNNINVIEEIYKESSNIENKDKIKEILNTSLIDIINHCRNKNRKEIGFLKGLERFYNDTKEKIRKKERLDYMEKYNELESSIYKYYQQKLNKSIKRNGKKLYDKNDQNEILFIYSNKKKIKNNNLQKFFNEIYSDKISSDEIEENYSYLTSNNQKKEEDNKYNDFDNQNLMNTNTDNQKKEDDGIDNSDIPNITNIRNTDNQEIKIKKSMNIKNNGNNFSFISTNLFSTQNNENNDDSFSFSGNDDLIAPPFSPIDN